MCLAPIKVLNPNYIRGGHGMSGRCDISTNEVMYSCLKDTQFKYIYVPCGHCAACRQMRQNNIVQRAREMYKDYHCIFVTATYKDEMLPTVQVNGRTFHYADIQDVIKMFKRIRTKCDRGEYDFPNFKYLYVSEYGSKRHRPHFHMLLFVPRSSSDTPLTAVRYANTFEEIFKKEWCRNVGSKRVPDYRPLSEFTRRWSPAKNRVVGTYDVHAVMPTANDPCCEDVAFYVTKYCLKFDKWADNLKSALFYNTPSDVFHDVWRDKIRPRMCISKGFGLSSCIDDYLRYCVDWSITNCPEKGPQYLTSDGKSFPMSRYYTQRILTPRDKVVFLSHSTNGFAPEGCRVSDAAKCGPDVSSQEASLREKKFDKIIKHLREDFFNMYEESDLDNSDFDDFYLEEEYLDPSISPSNEFD